MVKNNIKILESNYRIQFTLFVEDETISGSQTFYSKLKFDKILNNLKNSINKDSGTKIKIVLIDKKNFESKTIYGKILISKIEMTNSNDSNCSESKNKNKKVISKIEMTKNLLTIENNFNLLKENSYRIIIDNCMSVKSDKKSFTVICEDEIIDVKTKLISLFKKIRSKEIDDTLVFSDDNNNFSHRLLIQKSGSTKNYKEKSLGFSICFKNYSSTELIRLIIKYLSKQGGK